MKIVFLDASTLGNADLSSIRRFGSLDLFTTSSPEEALERVADADVLIVNKVRVTDEVMARAPKLKLICEAATGVNNIDIESAARRGISVRNVAGYSTDSVAQIAFAHILDLVCQTSRYDEHVKSGAYSASGLFTDVRSPYMELSGKTLGIVGMGTIGSRVAGIAEAFGMKVKYFSTSGTSHCTRYPSVSLDELLATSDVISIHAPLNERTNNLIDLEQIRKMKASAVIVNMARGGIVSEAGLAKAIDEELIAGAALDVFVKEPLPYDSPLLHTSHPERIRFSPHIGWASAEAIERLVAGVAANIENRTE